MIVVQDLTQQEMKAFKVFLGSILTLLVLSVSTAQTKWDKAIGKADAYYEIGDYEKANKALLKFNKKAKKKLGADHDYMAGYYMRQAKYNLAWGLLSDFENSINQSLETSKKKYGHSSTKHAKYLLEAAEAYTHYGNFVIAEEFVNEARLAQENSAEKDENLEAKIQLMTAKIYAGQGFYTKAQKYGDEIDQYLAGRAVTKETTVDASGKLKSTRLSNKEVDDRMTDYATLRTLRAFNHGEQGDIKSADSEFAKNSNWIKKNLGAKHLTYIQNNYLWGKMLEANGILDLTDFVKEASFEKSLSLIKKDYTASHYLSFEIFESMLQNYLKREERAKYRGARAEYEKSIKRYFKKNSIHYTTLSTIEFSTKLNKENTSNLQNKANNLLARSSAIPKYHQKRIDILQLLVGIAIAEKDYRNAEAYIDQIVDINKHLYGENAPLFHLSKIQLANFYLDYSSKFDEAGEIYETSFDNIVDKEINHWHLEYINILNHLAIYYEALDDYNKASEMLSKAANAAEAKYEPTDVEYGKELSYLAKVQIKIGDYDQAKNNIKTAIEILSDKNKFGYQVTDYIGALEVEAKFNAILGDFEGAEDNLDKSKKLIRKADNLLGYNELSSKQELAGLYISLGKYAETNEILSTLITEYENVYGTSSRNLIDPLVNYGHLKMITGDYTEAEKIARRVSKIALDTYGDKSTKLAPALILEAEINATLGDYDKALEHSTQALAIQEARFGKDHIDVAKSLTQQALILFYQGGFNAKAERLMTESKEIIGAKLGSRTPLYAQNQTNLATVYIAQKKYDQAFNSLELSEKIWLNKVGKRNNINAAEIYVLKGDLYYQQYNYSKAEENYEKSRKLYDKFFNKQHPDYVKVISKLSKVYYMSGDTRRAKKFINESIENYNGFIKKYFPALSEREKAKFWNTIKDDFEFYHTIAFGTMNEDPRMLENIYNNALLTKALLLSSSLKIKQQILSSGDELLIQHYNEWIGKKEVLTQALSMNDEQQAENGINAATLAGEVELLEKDLSERSSLFGQGSEDKAITWEKVRNVLKPNEVAVEMVRYRHFDHIFTDSVIYAALYLKNEKANPKPNVSLITNGKDLEHKYFKFYRNSIIYKIPDRYSYEEYWSPIKNFAGELSTIYFSADGVYNQINMEAIPTGDGKYVLDNSNIILVSNTRDIYLNKTRTRVVQKEKRALMFGNPDFYLSATASNKIADLPGTEKEVNELHALLKEKGWVTDDYMQLRANEDQVKALNNPKVFHIATHGFFKPSEDIEASKNIIEVNKNKAFENPLLRTGLLLKGAGDILDHTSTNYNSESGILTAYEAMNLNLDQTELVVLSACETGLGDLQVGEGVYGLQRAFLVAGARTLIMSMFKVDDDATQQLMVTFYRKWLDSGEMRKSFIEAKKEVRNTYKDPIYWGAFIMIGME